ncbi:MAG: hypothetical protein V1913_14250, partial [Fibrobacterota bacterium]
LILSSSDAIHWKTCPSETNENYRKIFFNENKFVALCNDGSLYSSLDGNTWSRVATDKNMADLSYSITSGNGQFVAVGASGFILTSNDGASWQRIRSPTQMDLHSVVFGNNLFVAVGYFGTIITSPAVIKTEILKIKNPI